MNMNSLYAQVITMFSEVLYKFGSPVLFVKESQSKIRIGLGFPQKHDLDTLYYDLLEKYIATFLEFITQEKQYPELVEALGREPILSDIRCAFRPLDWALSSFFVDDADPQFQQEYGHIWVETSPGNWQVHFQTDRIITANEALNLQREFSKLLNGDPSAVAGLQARRFPVPGLNVVINDNRPCYEVKDLLPKANETQTAKPIENCAKRKATPMTASWDLKKANKYWDLYMTDKAKAAGDASRADMYLVNRLVAEGVDDETIHYLLRHVSFGIEKRKAGHLDNYIDRTIQKALTRANNH